MATEHEQERLIGPRAVRTARERVDGLGLRPRARGLGLPRRRDGVHHEPADEIDRGADQRLAEGAEIGERGQPRDIEPRRHHRYLEHHRQGIGVPAAREHGAKGHDITPLKRGRGPECPRHKRPVHHGGGRVGSGHSTVTTSASVGAAGESGRSRVSRPSVVSGWGHRSTVIRSWVAGLRSTGRPP